MSERTFTADQIQALMERAAQLQADTQTRSDTGLTFSELEQVAAESGIDPQFLRAALREAESGVGLRNVAGQTKTHVFVEQAVPGTLTDEKWEAVVHRLRERFSSDLGMSFGLGPQYGPGVVEQLGSTRTWRHTSTAGLSTTATLRSVEGMQHVRIQRRVGLAPPAVEGVGYGLLAALPVAAVSGAALESGLWFALVFLVALLAFAPLITWLDKRWRARKLDEVEDVVAEIAGVLHEAPSEPETERAAPLSAPLLDLGALPEADGAVGRAPARRRDRA